jgi:hypothetical protein
MQVVPRNSLKRQLQLLRGVDGISTTYNMQRVNLACVCYQEMHTSVGRRRLMSAMELLSFFISFHFVSSPNRELDQLSR